MSLVDERNMIDASGWYIFSTDVIGNNWNDFQNSWGITFAEIESIIYSISSSSPVDISTNIITIPDPVDIFGGETIDMSILSIPNGAWNAYDISTNPTIDPFTPYWVHVLETSYRMTRIVQNDNGNQITKYIDVRGIMGYNSYVNVVDLENMISVTVGDLVDTISYNAFTNSPNLEIVNISKSVKLIQAGAFKNCSNLSIVVFQDDLTPELAINNTAFTESNLTEVYMTESLLDKLSSSEDILVFGTNVNFFGASNVTIKYLYELTKYTV
jgi:hypothetical protein